MAESNVIRIAPYKYVHIHDNNLNYTRVQVGPDTIVKQDHETLTEGPLDMIRLKPRSNITINNPIIIGKDGKPEIADSGEVKVNFGESEIRKYEDYKDPFPLYPYE
jgi:major vault protein